MSTDEPRPAPTHDGDAPGRTRVALVFGGRSSEHAVSCATAASVLEALDRDRYDVVPVGIAKDGHWVLAPDDPERLRLAPGHVPEVDTDAASVIVPTSATDRTLVVHEAGQPPRTLGEVDVVFPLLHGPFGEDGTIQGLLDLADVRYVGSGVTASAVMMDKHVMKVLLASAGLPVGPYTVITDKEWRRDKAAAMDAVHALSWPVFVKPARAGSSMGITKVSDPAGAGGGDRGGARARPEGGRRGRGLRREIECGVLEGHGTDATRTSELGECIVVQNHEFYDFEAKYLAAGDVRLETPADVPAAVADADPGDGGAGVRRRGLRGPGAGRLLPHRDRRRARQRGQHDAGVHAALDVPADVGGDGLGYPELIDELITLALERRTGLR